MRRHFVAGFAVMIAMAALSACASAAAPAAGPSSAPVNVTSVVTDAPAPTSPAPQPSAAPVTSPPVIVDPPGPSPIPGEGVTVIRGQITAGVEPSCKLLTDDKVEYLLLADSTMQIPVGGSAIVTGHVAHGIMTHCQQGIPFVVTAFRQLPMQQ
jgi:hypothetical protein